MSTKISIPALLKIKTPYDPNMLEDLLLIRYGIIINEGFRFSFKDFDLFLAILFRRSGIKNVSKSVQDYAIKDGKIIDRIRFEMINLAIQQNEKIQVEDECFYFLNKVKRAIERKKIVKKEIGRVVNNAKSINLNNSAYYRELLNIVTQYNDLTLIDWFIPIQLTFEKFVHIYVKHVEVTKFGDDKKFKKRSFFDYKHTEVLALLKSILKQEEIDIKDHFVRVQKGHIINDKTLVKDYHRGFGSFQKLYFDKNEFRLTIDTNGLIQQFFQIK